MARVGLNMEPGELGLPAGDTRPQPLITWLQFINFTTLAMCAWFFLKIYHCVLGVYEWVFPPSLLTDQQDLLILVIGSKTKLTKAILHQLSKMLDLPVYDLNDRNGNDAIEPQPRQGGIVWCHVNSCQQQAVVSLSKRVRDNFGAVDVLILAEHKPHLATESTTTSFLTNLNTQLLIQFWLVMAFLPSMMERNHGHIISVANNRTSALTNTGIMRTTYEDLLQCDTKVKLTLVERNSLLEKWCPGLSTHLLTRMLLVSALHTTSSSVISVPSISSYLLLLPTILLRLILRPLTKVLRNTSIRDHRQRLFR